MDTPRFALVRPDTRRYAHVVKLSDNADALAAFNKHHEMGLCRILFADEAEGQIVHPYDEPLAVGDRCLVLA